jgi:hypothetical protein
MSEPKKSPLVDATVALDEELTKVEQLTHSAARIPLSSRRNLEKAARTTSEAAEAQKNVGLRIGALMEALNAARVQNETTVAEMQTRSQEIQKRSQALEGLLGRFDAIGQEARELTELAQALTGPDAGEKLTELESRLGVIAESARGLQVEATDGDWSDLAREAESLRQQVLAVKNKLSLLAKRLSN